MLFCIKCDKDVDYIVKTIDFDYPVKEEIVKVLNAKLSYCLNCHNELFNKPLDEQNQKMAFEKYRELKGIIKPEKIIEIRKKYGLKQKDFSKLLGFGEITITRYENGSIPTLIQNNTISSVENPQTMLNFLNQNFELIDQKVSMKLKNLLKSLILADDNSPENLINKLISKYTILNQTDIVIDLNELKKNITN